MLQVYLEDHPNNLYQVMLKVHPVNGLPRYRVGYCAKELTPEGVLNWSLIAQHALEASHIVEVEKTLRRLVSGTDESGDSGGSGPETSDGALS